MRFRITRTSSGRGDQPCPEAVCEMEKVEGYPDPFPRWFMEIEDLNALMQFIETQADDFPIIMWNRGDSPSIKFDPFIEIYDGYRE